MDFLRSFYSVDAEFSDTPGGLPGTLRWFKAADGAKTFPADHAWGSLVWEDTNPGPPAGPGEQSRQRVWDKGDRPALKLGDSPDGPLEWFLDGVPLSAAGSPFIGSECDLMSLVNVRNLTASGTYVPTVGTKLIFVPRSSHRLPAPTRSQSAQPGPAARPGETDKTGGKPPSTPSLPAVATAGPVA